MARQSRSALGTKKCNFSASSRTLSVEYLPIAALRLDPRNPRIHTDKQLRQIAGSIQSFGFNVPVLVDAGLQVIAGHGRVLASKLLAQTTRCLPKAHTSLSRLTATRDGSGRVSAGSTAPSVTSTRFSMNMSISPISKPVVSRLKSSCASERILSSSPNS